MNDRIEELESEVKLLLSITDLMMNVREQSKCKTVVPKL